LDNSTKPFISLKNTLDYLQRYLEMEKIRTDHFTYSIEIDEELQAEEIFLPPMLIQPFIENAIWHGQQLNKQMLLTIQFLKRQNELICVVEDDGIGIETSLKNKGVNNHHSFGIANIRHRIQLLNEKYDLKSAVLVEDKSVLYGKNETGTKVTLHLPVKNTEL
jgi:sensor histidine kinase YesM